MEPYRSVSVSIRLFAIRAAVAFIHTSSRVNTGCSINRIGNCGNPNFDAVSFAKDSNGEDTTTIDGVPCSEQLMASCTLHDVQAPQSPMPLTITWARASISDRSSGVIECDEDSFLNTK